MLYYNFGAVNYDYNLFASGHNMTHKIKFFVFDILQSAMIYWMISEAKLLFILPYTFCSENIPDHY